VEHLGHFDMSTTSISGSLLGERQHTIVPLSTTAPRRLEAYHHAFMVNPLPDKSRLPCWAKCDMVATVSLSRLDRYKQPHGKFIVPQISEADFEALQMCVATALNLRH